MIQNREQAVAMLHRREEVEALVRDTQNRFPAEASTHYHELHKPIVNLWAERNNSSHNPWAPNDLAVCLTHDIDKLPDMGAVKHIDKAERSIGKSTWFFMATNPWPITRLEVRRAADWLRSRGHEIGFHPDIGSHINQYAMEREVSKFRSVFPQASCIRQHGLAFEVPATWWLHEQFGFKYDSTLGFAAREGFRSGYCLPYKPFDPAAGRYINVIEVPLIVMDVTLKYYREYTPDQAVASVSALIDAVKRVHGVFVLLWHNTFVAAEGTGWVTAYHRILERLEQQNAYVGTIPDVVGRFTKGGGNLCPLL